MTMRILGIESSCDETAAAVVEDGAVIYCNRRLAELLRTPLQEIIGSSLRRFVTAADLPAFDALVAQGKQGSSKGEISLQCPDAATVPVQLSFSVLEAQGI